MAKHLIDVECTIPQVDSERNPIPGSKFLKIISNPSSMSTVWLSFVDKNGDIVEVLVDAEQLELAIQNATNTVPYYIPRYRPSYNENAE